MKYSLILNYNDKLSIVCKSNSKNILVKELENRQGFHRMFNIKNPYKIVAK
jgi:hypothetical protein